MLEVKRKPVSSNLSAAASAPAQAYSEEAKGATSRSSSPGFIKPVVATPTKEPRDFHGKLPAITGECHFKGSISADGLLAGQIGVQSGLNLKQKPSGAFVSAAELSGEFNFKDAIRVNGHIAGSVYSKVGTIIVDVEAKVDANVDVAVAVIGGTVTGDIVARERVELGPASRIHGNIWTRSLVIKDGAIFEGVCRMIEED